MSEMRHHTTATHLPSDGHLPGQKTKKNKNFLAGFKKSRTFAAHLQKAHCDSVAQLVEQLTLNQWVVGSSPTGVTQNAQVAELVDAHVSGACAARCEGSSPFLGTRIPERESPVSFLCAKSAAPQKRPLSNEVYPQNAAQARHPAVTHLCVMC